MLLHEQISVSINSFQECLTSFRQITLYSCKESDHQSVVGMHTLMCIVILNSGMCSVDSCIVSDMHRLPSRGNCLEWDSMPTVWVAVLIPQVSVPFQRRRELRCGAVGISPYHHLIVYSHQMETEHVTCWGHGFWFPHLGEQ